jgi:glutathione S-transferase
MLKIWGRVNSVNVKKVMWCVGELGVPHERVDAGLAFGINNTPEFKAKNPNGLVPLIDDDGFILWESNAIVRYLSAKYGSGSLWATDPAVRAIGDKWMDWPTSTLVPEFRKVFHNVVRRPPEERNHAEAAEGIAACAKLFAMVDGALATQPYLSGQALGMGDIPLGCFAYLWLSMPIERPNMPHLEAWYGKLQERPAYQSGVMTPLS